MKREKKGCSIAVTVIGFFFLTSILSAQVIDPIFPGSINLNLWSLAFLNPSGQGEPLDLVSIPGDPGNRQFVATHDGFIRLLKNNSLVSTPFLDLSSRGFPVVGGFGTDERGLLGLAFSPNFYAAEGTSGRGKFYTYTSEAKAGNADFSHPEIGLAGGEHQSVIREWTVDPNNPDVADGTVAPRVLMRIAQPQANNNGGALRFGNDWAMAAGRMISSARSPAQPTAIPIPTAMPRTGPMSTAKSSASIPRAVTPPTASMAFLPTIRSSVPPHS